MNQGKDNFIRFFTYFRKKIKGYSTGYIMGTRDTHFLIRGQVLVIRPRLNKSAKAQGSGDLMTLSTDYADYADLSGRQDFFGFTLSLSGRKGQI